MVDCIGLENRRPRKGSGGSNPSSSAKEIPEDVRHKYHRCYAYVSGTQRCWFKKPYSRVDVVRTSGNNQIQVAIEFELF